MADLFNRLNAYLHHLYIVVLILSSEKTPVDSVVATTGQTVACQQLSPHHIISKSRAAFKLH